VITIHIWWLFTMLGIVAAAGVAVGLWLRSAPGPMVARYRVRGER